jgi:hypothetical protein
MEHIKIGEYLVKGGAVTQWQLDIALKKQEKEGGLIGEILINLGYIQDEQLITALRSQAENRS